MVELGGAVVAELTTKWLRRGTHRSVGELIASIQSWIDTWNQEPRPLCGPRPPTRSSRTSLGISSEPPTQDTSHALAYLRSSPVGCVQYDPLTPWDAGELDQDRLLTAPKSLR